MKATYKIFREGGTRPVFVALITSMHGEHFSALKKRAGQIYGLAWKQTLLKKLDIERGHK
jgi:hypothetical protein